MKKILFWIYGEAETGKSSLARNIRMYAVPRKFENHEPGCFGMVLDDYNGSKEDFEFLKKFLTKWNNNDLTVISHEAPSEDVIEFCKANEWNISTFEAKRIDI